MAAFFFVSAHICTANSELKHNVTSHGCFFVSGHIRTNLELKDTKERFAKIITGAKGIKILC